MKRLSAWPGHLPSEDALSACFDGISGSDPGGGGGGGGALSPPS